MNIAKNLMKKWLINEVDAARIVLECLEKSGMDGSESRGVLLRHLRRVVDEGVRVVRDAERTELFATAAWASVEARSGRRPTTRRDLRCFVRRMLRVEGVGEMLLRRMSVADCRSLLQKAFGRSPSSYRKARAILHSIFAYGMRHEWCDANPVDRIEAPVVQEKPVLPLTPNEVARLEAAAKMPEHAEMRTSLRLMLYCGLRPAEVKRLRPEDIRPREREVIIRPAVSKTGGGRVVPLRHTVGKLHIPKNWETRWRALRLAAGFSRWQADVCRHSFASYHAALFRDLSALQCEMGHRSSVLLRSRYVSPVRTRDAKRYWRM